MDLNLDDIDIALVVNVEILRQVLKKLSSNGKKWWIACEAAYALESGFVSVGYGDPNCVDRLNTVYYKLPILNQEPPLDGPDKLVVLVDSSVLVAEQPGLYREDDRLLEDPVADIEDFFLPIARALVPLLAEYGGYGEVGGPR